mmetsp:Transcript_15809/g.23768  ORF Transcript_15809/g.23768 Transcript_15809/m.23768 type:complete len:345 (-) Transcript_15809:162-1196(-)
MRNSSANYSNGLQAARLRRRNDKSFLIFITCISIFVLYCIDSKKSDAIFEKIAQSTSSVLGMEGGEEGEEAAHGLEEGKFHGRYPHSLLTLFYPYTMFRDIVLDQPINDTDIPFFWHLHNSDELIIKQILTQCYGLELIELNDMHSIQKAKDVNLVSGLNRNKHVITSPFIRETAEIFTTDNFGRMMCFFRHPLDYDIHPSLLEQHPPNDNWLSRLLSNVHDRKIEFFDLAIAKQVVRQTCLVGQLDEMKVSIIRFQEHWGWNYTNGMSKEEGELCVDDAMMGNVPAETWMDHESEEFKTFYKTNSLDCQLYEQSRSAWRHHIQTIIPWEIQLSRDEDDDEDEE